MEVNREGGVSSVTLTLTVRSPTTQRLTGSRSSSRRPAVVYPLRGSSAFKELYIAS